MANNNLPEGSFKGKVPSFPITARNIVSNLSGYFCRKGNRQLIEKNVQKRLFKRVSSTKKEEVNLSNYFTSFIEASLPYVKLKPKKRRGRRKKKVKIMRVNPIDRFTSKRKAFIMFSSLFKGINRQKKHFMSRLENELESIYTNSLKRNQTGVTKLPIIDKKDQLHKSAYKYKPYKWGRKPGSKAFSTKKLTYSLKLKLSTLKVNTIVAKINCKALFPN